MMQGIVHYQQCPACGSSQLEPVLKCKDFLVSGTEFGILECGQCTQRFTQDAPDSNTIGPYYQSEQYISHTDSDKGLINKLYKAARKFTLSQKRSLLHKLNPVLGSSLLDVGSGTGAFLDTMRRAGWTVAGVEPDEGARQIAKNVYGIDVLPADLFFSLPEASFDIITMWHVMEHVHDLQGYWAQLKKLLKPGGHLLVAVPNHTGSDARQYGAFWAAYDVPRHLYHFSPKSMDMLAAKHGFVLRQKLPMWLDAYYIAMLSEKYRNGRGNLPVAFWRGLQGSLRTMRSVDECSSVIYIMQPVAGSAR